MPRDFSQYVQAGKKPAPGALAVPGTPGGLPLNPTELDVLKAILFQVSPPQPLLNSPQTTSLSVDGPTTIFNPFPTNCRVWAIYNNSSSHNLAYWYTYTTVTPTVNYMTLPAGIYRAYAVIPPVLMVARTAGDASASVTLELFG